MIINFNASTVHQPFQYKPMILASAKWNLFAGLLGEEVGATLLGGALVLSAGAGALAAGVPLLFMPAPLIAAAGLALYYESGMLRDYLLFVGGAVLSAAWFVHHHFWFLEVLLERMALLTICKLLLAAIVPATLLPGLVLAGASKAAIGVLLVAQVCARTRESGREGEGGR